MSTALTMYAETNEVRLIEPRRHTVFQEVVVSTASAGVEHTNGGGSCSRV